MFSGRFLRFWFFNLRKKPERRILERLRFSLILSTSIIAYPETLSRAKGGEKEIKLKFLFFNLLLSQLLMK